MNTCTVCLRVRIVYISYGALFYSRDVKPPSVFGAYSYYSSEEHILGVRSMSLSMSMKYVLKPRDLKKHNRCHVRCTLLISNQCSLTSSELLHALPEILHAVYELWRKSTMQLLHGKSIPKSLACISDYQHKCKYNSLIKRRKVVIFIRLIRQIWLLSIPMIHVMSCFACILDIVNQN